MKKTSSWLYAVRGSYYLGFVIVMLLQTSLGYKPASSSDDHTVDGWMKRMSLEDKIAQMNHVPIRSIMKDIEKDPTLDKEKLRSYIKKIPIGLIANTPFDGGPLANRSGWTIQEWRETMRGIQEVAQEEGIPPIIYALDHVHGANYVQGATIFPQQINLASTFNIDLAHATGRIMAKDTKAVGCQWIFSPILDLYQQPAWSRTYETFGEDPYLLSKMGRAIIEGMQGPDERFPTLPPAMGTMKHFIGYGNSKIGHDRGPVDVSDRTVRQTYLPAFREAVKANVRGGMTAYIEIAGVPMVSNRLYTIDLLRHELEWTGLLKPDYQEMQNLWTWHMVTDTSRESARIALQDTSIDQFTNPTDTTYPNMLALVKEGIIPESRIDESIRRILETKDWLGLLKDPLQDALLGYDTEALPNSIGSPEDKEAALEAARESIILLKNEGDLLPLSKTKRVLMTGQGCSSLSYQTGGWSIHWQGAQDSEFVYGRTILQGLTAQVAGEGGITYIPGVSIKGEDLGGEKGKDAAVEKAKSGDVDVVVACVGEGAYAEKPGDIDDPNLPSGQGNFIQELNKTGLPIIVILVEGRARLLQGIPDLATSVLHAWLPGPAGGRAIADILTGAVNPSGRLSITYPKYTGTMLHGYHGKPSEKCTSPQNGFEIIECPVEWAFGSGLSYTTFSYSKPILSATTISEKDTLDIHITVTNTGNVAGKEALLLFITDYARRVTPESKLLRRFIKTPLLQPGHSFTYSTSLTPFEDLSYWGLGDEPRSRELLESGLFYLGLGPSVDCRSKPKECTPFNLTLTDTYNPICDAACKMWSQATRKCSPETLALIANEGGSVPKAFLAAQGGASSRYPSECHEQCLADQDWDWNYVSCLEQQVWKGTCRLTQHCRSYWPSSSASDSKEAGLSLMEGKEEERKRYDGEEHNEKGGKGEAVGEEKQQQQGAQGGGRGEGQQKFEPPKQKDATRTSHHHQIGAASPFSPSSSNTLDFSTVVSTNPTTSSSPWISFIGGIIFSSLGMTFFALYVIRRRNRVREERMATTQASRGTIV